MNYEGVEAPTFWSSVKEAIRGAHHDYTEVSLSRAVLLLAVPMVLETMMESVFAVVDIFWVSHLGASAIATVGLTEAMITILYAVAFGLCMGATATVARRIGEKNPDAAALTAVQAILMALAFAIPIGIVGGVLAPQLLTWMGASNEVIERGTGYTRIMLAGNATIFLLYLINAIFRGAGDAAIAMRVLWLANWINILLGPCFIFGLGPFPKLGVTGAAIATNIGRGSGVLFQLYKLSRKDGRIKIGKHHLRVDTGIMKNILGISGIGIFQSLIGMTSWIGLIRILSSFGSVAVAGYTVGIRIIIFALLPSWGLSNAAATLVGQNLGAQKPDRAEKSVWITCRHNFVFLGIIGTLFLVFAPFLISIFTKDPAVAQFGIQCLRIVSCGFLFYAYGMVVTQAFNGAGDTWTPTFINVFCFWLCEIPLGYFLSRHAGWGPSGVFFAITFAFSLLAVISVVIFRKGRWKLRKV
ncbi:MAG: MATE family efflux transporter [Acidobacteria bacterium]|nr:MAG: MATE family efflux transporter [Acidobacteriota bacterium]